MNFHPIDYIIVACCFAAAVVSGFLFSRKSASSLKSYFLGSENKWWMLAASGASTNFSINGTVWNIAILMVLGMKSFFVTLVWWMPNAVFLMSYSGIWIRRCGTMTAAEINKARFGSGAGARCSRTTFAFMITLFSVASLCLSYIVIHKFGIVFGCTAKGAHALAVAVVGLTSAYVLFGGFKGVIFSEFLQTVLLFSVAFVIGCVCYGQYDAGSLHAALAHGSGADLVTPGYWKSLIPEAAPRIGMFSSSGYSGWSDFSGMVLAGSIVGLIGCAGGAGGRYGEQRFLATRNTREASMMAALWQFLGLPRWVMTAGLCFFAFALYKVQVARDPEAAMPLFLQSGLLRPGLLGLVVAGLSASFMTSFCSEINACASIIVQDLYRPLLRPNLSDDSRELVKTGYGVTVALALLAIGLGYGIVEAKDYGSSSALNVVWAWMLGGLLTCLVVPLALRWYWGRMNGWGFSAGCLAGLVPSLLMLASGFSRKESLLGRIPVNGYIYITLIVSTAACIVVSVLTPPIEAEWSAQFYAKVRPFGIWSKARESALALGLAMAPELSAPFATLNVVVGLVASFSLFMAPVYFLGRWFADGTACALLFSGCVAVLYFTWYRRLPSD
jgi:solute:Na+ symporter, SSS family